MVLPNFLGIGAQRSGTTWLDRQLRSHPQVYLPERRKEVHFFDRYYERGLDWYLRFFPPAAEAAKYRCIGEITPMYFYHAQVPERIHALLPACRFIALLRDPTERAYSQYSLHVQSKGEGRPFRDFFKQEPDVLGRGLYFQQIKRYLHYFPLHSFLFLIFEHTISHPAVALRQVAEFLSIDPESFDYDKATTKANVSHRVRFTGSSALMHRYAEFLRHHDLDWLVRKSKALGLQRFWGNAGNLPRISAEVRAELITHYRQDIDALEELLGKDLSAWKRPRPT